MNKKRRNAPYPKIKLIKSYVFDKIPCDIWKKTRDPKFTDEEFEKSINDRVEMLKEQLVSNK